MSTGPTRLPRLSTRREARRHQRKPLKPRLQGAHLQKPTAPHPKAGAGTSVPRRSPQPPTPRQDALVRRPGPKGHIIPRAGASRQSRLSPHGHSFPIHRPPAADRLRPPSHHHAGLGLPSLPQASLRAARHPLTLPRLPRGTRSSFPALVIGPAAPSQDLTQT